MSEGFQLSRATLCVKIQKWQWVSDSVTKVRYRAARAAKNEEKNPCLVLLLILVWVMSLGNATKLPGKRLLTTLLPNVTSKWSPANPLMLLHQANLFCRLYQIIWIWTYFAFLTILRLSENSKNTLVVSLIATASFFVFFRQDRVSISFLVNHSQKLQAPQIRELLLGAYIQKTGNS